MKSNIGKSDSFQVYRSQTSSCSETSNSSSSSDNSDTPLKRFNRLVRTSVARHWAHFRKKKSRLLVRGRSVSDTGLCSIVDREVNYLDIGSGKHHSLLVLDGARHYTVPALFVTVLEVYINYQVISRFKKIFRSAGGSASALGLEEASDSDAERPRRHHLRVPSPHYIAQSTGNFAGAAGGGCGAPRSAPATPLQLESHPRTTKHDK
ncbi:unnamed protein product [Parnassius apollo]|uniref:(apollo) hypothetical protein n=1 Tax=Parnassius apollo TaxID=110799 RepID=A0A8S3W6U8_PARAO|nr:unnamed protein product [Parnassius apollo]